MHIMAQLNTNLYLFIYLLLPSNYANNKLQKMKLFLCICAQ